MENVDTNSSGALELEHEQTPTSPSSTSSSSPSSRELGGWRSIKYIIGNESFEKLASMSLISNLTLYLLTNYNLSGIFVVNVMQIWSGSSNIFSIVGAFISDTYLGRYRTLLYGWMGDLLGSFPESVRVRTKHAEKSCGAARMSDMRGVTNGIRAWFSHPVRCGSGTNQAEAGGHVTARTHRKERDPVDSGMGDLLGSFPESVRVRIKHAEKSCGGL
ncbi:hypothetical protein Fmac_026313 [Flemingia macrophylla]|uniref:Uncharacterized protein n=1 Tax=Flemingia macrophylla TaxID=520843 RepID=A0ABD1LEI1_9FABA